MRRQQLTLFVLGSIALLPQPAGANVGTSLMWAQLGHMFVGNLLIGLGEGLLLGWLFSAPRLKSIFIMILANYTSAWIGAFALDAVMARLPVDLNNGWTWIRVGIVASYCMTLVLEWPFVWWCLRRTQGRRRRSLKASLLLQTASYALLFGWYVPASDTSLFTRMRVVPPTAMSLPDSVQVYYISAVDGDVHRLALMGGDDQRIRGLGSADNDDRLFVRRGRPGADHGDLMARLETAGDPDHPRLVLVRSGLRVADLALPKASPASWDSTERFAELDNGEMRGSGPALRLGAAAWSPWDFGISYWTSEGLSAVNDSTKETAHFSLQTPILTWAPSHSTHLPGDVVLFQLNSNQICVFDPRAHAVALLAHGRGPVAVIDRLEGGRVPGNRGTEGPPSPATR